MLKSSLTVSVAAGAPKDARLHTRSCTHPHSKTQPQVGQSMMGCLKWCTEIEACTACTGSVLSYKADGDPRQRCLLTGAQKQGSLLELCAIEPIKLVVTEQWTLQHTLLEGWHPCKVQK